VADHKILVTGGNGKLAKRLQKEFDCSCPPKQELDVTNYHQVRDYLIHHPEIKIIIHAGAVTSVSKCESDKELAYNVNVNGTKNVIKAIHDNDHHKSGSPREIKLIYISTPCIFDGKTGNYDEDSLPHPENYYGLTKYISEELIKTSGLQHLIIRTNFVEKEPWVYDHAFTDRYGTYLFAEQVAQSMKMHINNSEGIVHIVGKDKLSMFELAKITTPDIKPLKYTKWYRDNVMVHGDDKIPRLTKDMTMISKRWHAKEIDRS
jgi:dTDP-4-dehydrorhamnose reductase